MQRVRTIDALPFTFPILAAGTVFAGVFFGGVWTWAGLVWGFVGLTILDRLTGVDTRNFDPATPEKLLWPFRLITLVWVPVQLSLLILTFVRIEMFSVWELVGLTLSLATFTGGGGLTIAHELIHQKSRLEQAAGEILLYSVLYPQFQIEHVHGHHRRVGTEEDPATARYGESYYAFLARTLPGSLIAAFKIEADLLARRGVSPYGLQNRFWRYGALSLAFCGTAFVLGGGAALIVFLAQAWIAIQILQATAYIEHYGLERRRAQNGKYERIAPHHSWNASTRASNWMLMNLQRHSDHHHRANRPYPVLQHYTEEEAPQLPYGYPVMTLLAFAPPLWFRIMDPKVAAWRARFDDSAAKT